MRYWIYLALLCDTLASEGDIKDNVKTDDADISEPEESSKTVLHASLITLVSRENDCALKTTSKKYPLRFVRKM